MDKITEKEIRQPDAFIQTIDKVNATLQPKRHLIVVALLIVIVAAVGWALYDWNTSRREAQAQEALFIATHQVEKKAQEIEAATPKPKAETLDKNGKTKPPAKAASETLERPKNFEADYGVPVKTLQSVADTYPGTRAAGLAALEIARIYQDYGQIDPALQALQKAEVGTRANDLISATIQLRIGDLLQIKGQCDQAIAKWSLVSGPSGFAVLKPEALLRTGLCYETLKKYDDARTTYEKLTRDPAPSDTTTSGKSARPPSEPRAVREGKKFLKLLQATGRAS